VVLEFESLAFDPQRVNTTSTAKTVKVSNTGALPLVVSSLSVTGPYAVTPTGGFTLAANGGERVLSVTFTPTAEGVASGAITMATDDPDKPSATVSLTGTGQKPTVSLNAASLNFGSQRVNTTSAAKTVTVTNLGSLPLIVSGVAKTGPYAVTPSGTFTLAANGGQQDLTVTFTPTAAGPADGSLTVSSDDPANPTVSVDLEGIGAKPTVVLDPDSLTFGEQRVNTTSATKTVRVLNTGALPLIVTSVTKTGPYVVTPNTGFTVAAGDEQVLTVTFTPGAEGPLPGSITLATDDPSNPNASIGLSGVGIQPELELLPATVAFGPQRVDTTSAAKILKIRNKRSGTLYISSLSITPGSPFTFSAPNTPIALPGGPGGGQPVDVLLQFAPDAEESETATLTLNTSDPVIQSAQVTLTGTGVKPKLQLSAQSLAFNTQYVGSPSAPLTVTVKNEGSGPVRINSLNITAGKPFTVSPSTGFDLAPNGGERVLSVVFSPTAVGAVTDAFLTLVTDEATPSSSPISLTGTGISFLVMDPAGELDFGPVAKEQTVTRTVTITNATAAPIQISAVSAVSPPFTITGLSPGTLDPRAAKTFTVSFKPTSAGEVNATLTLQSSAHNSPHVLTLKGTGTVPQAQFSLPTGGGSITSLAFQGVLEDTTFRRTVRLSNIGQAPLTISELPGATSPFGYLGPASITINPGTYIDFDVSFSPTESIPYNGVLTVISDAVNSPTHLSLTGFGASPQLSRSPSSIFFGDWRVGSNSTKASVTINNTGNAPVNVQGLPVEGAFTVALRGTDKLPHKINPNTDFSFDVIFKPAAEGPTKGFLSVVTDINNADALKVELNGNGIVSKVKLSAAEIDFAEQRVGHESGVQPLIITNSGAAELQLTQIIFSEASFRLATAPPTAGIPAGGQVALPVIFDPKTLGPAEGLLYIISNAFEPAVPVQLKGTAVDGQMTATPSAVSFGTAEVGGAEVQQTVKLVNTGSYTLRITKVNPPLNGAFTIAGLPDNLVLQKGGEWFFTVTFKPNTRGFVSTSAIIESDAVTNPLLNLTLSGTGVAAAMELQPQDLNFGNANQGVSVTQDLSVKNIGEKDLSVSTIAFADKETGPQGASLDFSLDGVTLPLVVKPGDSSLVRLKFSPRAIGERSARAIVFSNAKNKPPGKELEAGLVGNGTSPQVALSVDGEPVSRLDFGNVLVGNPSIPITLRITNKGNGPLSLSGMSLGGADASAFILAPSTLSVTLQPQGFAEVSVAVKPDAERPFSAQLSLVTNNMGAPNVTVPLGAVGVRQQIQLSESTLDFGRQLVNYTSKARTVSVTNSSASRATISGLSVEGSGASQFSLATVPLPRPLEPGKGVDLSLTFTPVAEAEVNSKLKVTFSEPPLQLEVSLHGQGIPTVLSVSPSPLDFGTVRVGSNKREQPLTIANLSSEPITLAPPDVLYRTGEPFLYEQDSLAGRTIGPGSSIIVTMSYQPQVETLSETTLALGTTTPPRPRSTELQLKGRATSRLLTVDPGSLDFGRVDVSDTVEPREITVVNKSSQQQRVEVSLKEASGTSFTVDAAALRDPIPAEGSATFKISFKPDKAGPQTNEVQVRIQDSDEPEATVAVSGSGRELTGQGGGCSSTGTAVGGALAMLALVLLGSRRRRRA
jgi:uncharacterized protein (TIGR03382 family)